MKTLLSYVFSPSCFNIKEMLIIEFDNPPYIPESKQLINIDFHQFFDDETADEIVRNLEDDKNLLPYKTMEVWNKDGVHIGFEFMNINKAVTYRAK